MNVAEKYIDDVIKGRIITGKYAYLSVKRHIDDLENHLDKGLYFDKKAANHALKFYPLFLTHTKGRQFAGEKFELSPWEAFIAWVVYGWFNADGTRRFNYVYIEVARKNGKSTFLSGTGLYMLEADGEPGSEVYSFATKEKQAKIILSEAMNMVKKSPSLNKRLIVYTANIHSDITFSKFEALGSDSKRQDGLNPHCGLNDEYHEHPDDGMFNVIKSAMGSRENPILFTITTAGTNKSGPCYQERNTCVKILEGILEQENKFAIIYTLDEDDNWEDPKNWIKSNPNLNISISEKYLVNEYKDCKNNPSRINNFKTKNLNIWTNTNIMFIKDDDWMKCDFKKLTEKDIIGRECYMGLDLASHVDINALSLYFPDDDINDIFIYFWVPEQKVTDNQDKVDYRLWTDQGYLRTTPGNTIDVDFISNDILNIISKVDCKGFAYDRFKAHHGIIQNIAKGMNIDMDNENEDSLLSPFGQGFVSMSEPTKTFQELILGQKINHGGNPILRWMNSNVVITTDDAENIKITRRRSSGKVDGMISSVMAIGEWMTRVDLNSVYDDRGIITI